ncbi:MAG: hypothetical protein WBF88_05215 [Pusillimonas sp.]
MKKSMALLALLLLAGCANNGVGSGAMALRDDANFRGQRVLPMTFPQIQMALFKHEAACGTAPQFALEPGQTAYATLTDKPLVGTSYRDAVLAELMYYRASDLGSWLAKDEERDWRTRAKIYSYYTGTEIDARIDQMFRAVTHPGECAGQTPEAGVSPPTDDPDVKR